MPPPTVPAGRPPRPSGPASSNCTWRRSTSPGCARCRSGRGRTRPEARPALLAGDPEAPAALRRPGVARLALLRGRRGRLLARGGGARRGGLVRTGALRRLTDEPRVGHLEV